MSGAAPIGSDVPQRQPDEFRRGLAGREVAPGLDDLAQLRVARALMADLTVVVSER